MKKKTSGDTPGAEAPAKRGRGRPRSPQAMSGAERQRAYRQRQAPFEKSRRPGAMKATAERELRRALKAGESKPAVLAALTMALMLGVFTPDEFREWAQKIRNA